MMALGGHPRDLEETAARQVERLGYGPEDVRHIVLTHFHYDHAGGLPDFPRAKVHIFRDEYEAVTKPQDVYERYPYRAEHWPHGPDWVVHPLQGDEWFGFDCTPPVGLGSTKFCLVPLPGHTRGHSGVALRLPDGWLLHLASTHLGFGRCCARMVTKYGWRVPMIRTNLRSSDDEQKSAFARFDASCYTGWQACCVVRVA